MNSPGQVCPRRFRLWAAALIGPLWLTSLVRPSTCSAASLAAQYEVRFDATWSAATHPLNFPPNPHWSPLVGGTHDESVQFWAAGELASLGIKDMAERGLTAPLAAEVQAAIDSGSAGAILLGGGISVSPGSISFTFTISQPMPLVTLVSMVAPSPDWFAGVNGLPLFVNDAWVDSITVPLQAFDAGTDSGTNYTSANQATVPPVPIVLNPAPHFASGSPLGTFTFHRLDVTSDSEGMRRSGAFGMLSCSPNPFRVGTGLRFTLSRTAPVRITVYDAAGRLRRILVAASLGPGEHLVRWDGTDGSGRPSGSGVYYLHLRSMDQTANIRVVRLD